MRFSLKLDSSVAFASLLGLTLLTGVSCTKGLSWKSHSFSSHDLTKSYAQAEVPKGLWEKLEALVTSPKETRGDVLPTAFVPLKVFLVEKNRGILFKGHTEVLFAPGGGELDLKDFVSERNGSFYFVADFLPGIEGVKRHVYFLSNSVARKIGEERLGSGCKNYYDVTSAFEKAVASEGFLVNTTAGRHVSALAGTYFFAAYHGGQLYLSSLIIKDSSKKGLHCRL